MWFKKKQRPRTYRIKTPKQKAEELLEKAWLKDLSEHPEYAREIARQKFGSFAEPEGQYTGEPPPDLLDTLRTAKEARNLVSDELGGGEKQGWLATLPEIMKALPEAIRGLKELGGMVPQGAQLEPEPPSKRIEQPKTREQQLTEFAEHFTNLKPEEAAQELFESRDKTGDVRAILWNTILENTADDLITMLPMLETVAEYAFLKPFAQKLMTNKGKQWVTLVIDEVNRLNEGEITPEKPTGVE